MLRALLPSFVADFVWPEHKPNRKIHPTSYLDGLRGIASFIVVLCHYTEDNHRYFVPSYGLKPGDQTSSWLQLPYLRVIYSGRPMVHIFFIISGFVLSYKPVKAMHARDLEKCYSTLASSTFRRPIRLYGPCIVSTFLIVLLIQAGCLYKPLRRTTISEQLWLWKDALFHGITWPWAWDMDLAPAYDIHLWTIPIEFAHSMLLFLVMLCLSRLRLGPRLGAAVLLMVYCLCAGKWAAFLFIGGMFLAELHVLQSSHQKSLEGFEEPSDRGQGFCPAVRTAFHVVVILAWLFVAGWPNVDADKTPGIRYLLEQTPSPFAEWGDRMPQKFWFSVSGLFAVWSLGEMEIVRRFLEGDFAQYCGRLSYAIYIVHGPILNMSQAQVIGSIATAALGAPGAPDFVPPTAGGGVKGMIGVESTAQRLTCWLVGLLILGPVIVWAADVFWRCVDVPMISLGRRLENALLDNTTRDGYSLA